ncbi:energy transducer TonB [Steroidobacter sp. S1-65]|uniref:Energy transducer TonB n=1 Tax=Steroidobacter gossypii TaxID=2805490 RepID=A0ABS1WZF7_9GAMM|nr:energy transducer TonB [Steroidobacter gossypii]MBM0106361.1 energy transducer TonB [Steroidobacter gossypii]
MKSSSTPPSQLAAPAWRHWGGVATGVALLAAVSAFIWYLLSDTAATKREVAATPMLMLPPPPPPPPEPEKLPEPEPEIEPEVVEPEPTPLDQPLDEAPPTPVESFSDPVTIAGEAQAGTDAFGVQSGRGGGMAGTGGLGSGSYARYVSAMLQQALLRDPRTRHLVFSELRIDLWLDADGKPVRAELVRSSGNEKTDAAVLELVRELENIDERPPASLSFPMRVAMQGRRP